MINDLPCIVIFPTWPIYLKIFLRCKKILALCHILERRSASTRGGTVEECHKVADLSGENFELKVDPRKQRNDDHVV